MKSVMIVPSIQWQRLIRPCIAGCLLLLASTVRADGIADEDRHRTAGATGAGGTLRAIGAYPINPEIFEVSALKGFSVTALANGNVYLYGVDPAALFEPLGPYATGGARNVTLRKRREHSISGALYSGPLLWNSQKRGWEKLPRAPECPGHRLLHTATALANGKVLIAGGLCETPRMRDDNSPSTAYTKLSLWDAEGNKWEAAPSLHAARIYHSATLLKDGSVLIAGGESDPALSASGEPVLNSVENFRDGSVTELAPLNVARARHSATLTADGRVLVAGGFDQDGKAIASVEIWDPAKHRWYAGAPLKIPRYRHTTTLLGDGRVMTAGGIGQDGMPVGAVEIWDPANNSWSSAAPLLMPLQGHSAALLSSGNVLVMGGATVDAVAVRLAMLWDKARGQWLSAGSTASDPVNAKILHPVTLVPRADGSAHVFGYPWIAQWTPTKKPAATVTAYGTRDNQATTLLRDGRVLLTGGNSGNAFLDWAEIFNPVSGLFSVTARMQQARHSHSAVLLDDGRVVVAGGWVRTPDRPGQPAANSPEVWDPVTGRWGMLKSIRFEWQDWVQLGKLADGRVLFFASRELAEGAPQGPVEYRAWVWNPRTGHVESRQPRATPHSKAAISILPDGRVLRIGGYVRRFEPAERCPPAAASRSDCNAQPDQWLETPASGSEIWNSHTGAVTALEVPPDLTAMRLSSPKSMVLRNGNVLVVDYTPPRPHGVLRPAPVLLWNAQTNKWRSLPPLPVESGWPITELKNGTLMSNTRWLLPNADAWSPAPAYPQYAWPNASKVSSTILQLASGQLLALSTSRPHVAVFDEKSKAWKLRSNNYLLRENTRRPALLPLADGRLLVSGIAEGRVGPHPTVQIWNPKDDSWTVTTSPAGVYAGMLQAAQLPSGRVLHLGLDSSSNLVCETWQPADDSWKPCGYLKSKDKPIRQFYLGTLEDGRAGLMIGSNEILIFDDNTDAWVPMRVEWNNSSLSYGAPIRNGGFVARVFDSAANTRVDASSLASRYYSDHSVALLPESWGAWRSLANVATAFFWHPGKREFSYIHRIKSFPLSSKSGMGKEAVLLPDDCVLSVNPLSVFNPETGKVTALTEPGIGIPGGARNFVALADGTVVIAGYPAGMAGEGAGFFHRKASCAGFEVLPGDDAFMPGVHVGANAATATAEAPPPAPSIPWWTRLRDGAWEYRWIILALLGPLLLYGLLRSAILPALRQASEYVAARVLSKQKIELLQRELPKPFAWGSRAILYGLLLIIAVPMLLYYVQFKRVTSAQDCADNPATCLDRETGILPSVPALEKTNAGATSKPTIPCRYVGVWSSIQGTTMHRITLKDDGTYAMDPNEYLGGRGYTGFWAVQNNNMVWRHNTGDSGEPDINPILPESDTRFVLVETNGKHTQYELIRAVKSNRCAP